MLAYNYDDNNEFIGCETLQKDPLEKDRWLIPANSTLTAPPQYNPKQQKCVFDGTDWKIVEIIPEESLIPEPTAEETAQRQRRKRDMLLYATDKYMLEDYPITPTQRQDYIRYRQYLRDIPESPDFLTVKIKTYEEWKGA